MRRVEAMLHCRSSVLCVCLSKFVLESLGAGALDFFAEGAEGFEATGAVGEEAGVLRGLWHAGDLGGVLDGVGDF
jgi:hypothetical protein